VLLLDELRGRLDVAFKQCGLLALPAILVAPLAARLARRLPVPMLRRLFALCLFAIGLRVVWRMAGAA